MAAGTGAGAAARMNFNVVGCTRAFKNQALRVVTIYALSACREGHGRFSFSGLRFERLAMTAGAGREARRECEPFVEHRAIA